MIELENSSSARVFPTECLPLIVFRPRLLQHGSEILTANLQDCFVHVNRFPFHLYCEIAGQLRVRMRVYSEYIGCPAITVKYFNSVHHVWIGLEFTITKHRREFALSSPLHPGINRY